METSRKRPFGQMFTKLQEQPIRIRIILTRLFSHAFIIGIRPGISNEIAIDEVVVLIQERE
jgi:hypothetical protein